MVKVTLLALMSQRFQPLLSPTARGSFRNNSSIIDIHAPFSCPKPLPMIHAMHARGEGERYLHETLALIWS